MRNKRYTYQCIIIIGVIATRACW